MIKKTLIYSLGLFLIYNLVLYFWNPSFISSQGFWQDNQIKAQEYVYTKNYDHTENIIVGSSMSFRIASDSLNGFCNLAFLGESYINGLELIIEKGKYPKRVFIETNFPASINNKGLFYDVLYNPVLNPLRTYLPALRDGKQPILIASSELEYSILNYTINKDERDKYAAIFKTFAEPVPGVGLYAGFTQEVTSSEMEKAFGDLNNLIDDLKSHGTEVIFFEMPYYRTLYYSPRVTSLRKIFREAFPPNEYAYLPQPGYDEYQTLDGLHLGQEEALKYTKQFQSRVDSLIHIGK